MAKDPDARYATAGVCSPTHCAALPRMTSATRAAPRASRSPQAATVVRSPPRRAAAGRRRGRARRSSRPQRRRRRRGLALAGAAPPAHHAARPTRSSRRSSTSCAQSAASAPQRRQRPRRRLPLPDQPERGEQPHEAGRGETAGRRSTTSPGSARRPRRRRKPSRSSETALQPLDPGRRRLPQRLPLRDTRAVSADKRLLRRPPRRRTGQATQAKIRFVAAFNPLAMRFGRPDLDGGRDLRRMPAAIAVAAFVLAACGAEVSRVGAGVPRPRIVVEADPVRAGPARRDARVREAPLRHRQLAARAPARDRRALHRVRQLRLGLRDVRLERAERSASSPASARTS